MKQFTGLRVGMETRKLFKMIAAAKGLRIHEAVHEAGLEYMKTLDEDKVKFTALRSERPRPVIADEFNVDTAPSENYDGSWFKPGQVKENCRFAEGEAQEA